MKTGDFLGEITMMKWVNKARCFFTNVELCSPTYRAARWMTHCRTSLTQQRPMGCTSYGAHFTAMLCVALLSVGAHAQNRLSDKYSERQTFGREAFDKDNNIWVYSPKFAETFGMPPDYTQELKGFEA